MIRLGPTMQVLLAAFAALAVLILYGPVLLVVLLSFFSLTHGQIDWSSVGLQNYALLFANGKIGGSLLYTLVVGSCSVLVSVGLSLIFALFARNESRAGARLQIATISFPFVAPPIITGLALLIFFRQAHIERSLSTIVIAHTVFVLALVYRIVANRLDSLARSIFEAAEDLGASPVQTLFLVVLPNMWGALLAAGALAFALSFDETLITLLVTGTEMTLPVRLWSMMRLGFSPDVNSLVTVILAISLLGAAFGMRYLRSDSRP
ncbi:ABC transporter permease subunit [Mesorhizobium sp. M3A.F.Ca.ET.201.01.1.1]|uniref:ABC transporter permease n=1 Tax=Mesorhizobium sp. M3A.F.Ca.ET.201.01.1.1 TaxID=2563946 RepID=UPI001093B7E5|nr:ABC transporter permease subunit [Mesorhizobium sp. M3A.F.Ca.ET.201.01.1.1]TGS71750.1 ABC transporter permease subunit [Mesorhizobium sp. M3A.F.Ca.ET.201.01.1.1]